MSKKSEGLNGSVDLLARAMREVFTEAVQSAVEPLNDNVKALRSEVRDMDNRIKNDMADMKDDVLKQIDSEGKEIRSGVYGQLAEQQKQIGQIKGKKSSPSP